MGIKNPKRALKAYRLVIKFRITGHLARRYEFPSDQEANEWLRIIRQAIPGDQEQRIVDILIEPCDENENEVA